MEEKQTKDINVKIGTDTTELDAAIEKANQLKELLGEVHELIDSLGGTTNIFNMCDR